ncbi:TetR family transcriptional regulator [Phycicoccus sp. CSK15P-2]|uniref:TetR/AcrR family transcriptional regulator n=1 Tax=Phycicoccus sp. CSK15P-2 TaxID=2807627 RepID=UPI00194DC299|nr:TetR/AcrR family transcriptional regulator [Phycicoccus sp. CSK15P-2]MBM6405894.1 TetR family transcriptional regulator [Phycicoccus sp. CSK15P-2]
MSQPSRGTARTEATQDRLYRAAVEAFAAKGFHGTSTRDIAAAAGMSPAALYVHHRSKEEILFRISRRGHESILAVVRSARASTSEPREALRAVVREFVAYHARSHTSARIVNYELAALDAEHRADIEGLRHAIDAEVQGLVAEGVAAGVFECPEPRIAAAALTSLGVDVARWYREDGGWTPEQLGEHYADVALRVVGAVPEG